MQTTPSTPDTDLQADNLRRAAIDKSVKGPVLFLFTNGAFWLMLSTILGVLAAGQKVQIEPFDLLFREVQFLSSFINPFTQDRAAAMIAAGTIQIAPLISRTMPLEQAADAIMNPPRSGEIRALVLPHG